MTKKIFEAWAKISPKKFREDLRLAASADSLGFTVHCNPKDEQDTPNFPIKFSKGNKIIWKAVVGSSVVWRCADVINDRYTNHRSYTYLGTALETEK